MTNAIARTYVWHNDKCFAVSTINRASSAVAAYGHMYSETMVWEWDAAAGEAGRLIGQDDSWKDNIRQHIEIVQRLRDRGTMEEPNDDY